jgi:REP element-mobilizing transposase RayT
MPLPREQLVSLSDTPYYHVVSRCVRRTFLCGVDDKSGKSFEHRRHWIEGRIRILSSIFTIDICAYAVMSNHYHIVVKLNPDEASHWSMDEVFNRWCALYKGPLLIRKYLDGEDISQAEMVTVQRFEALYRQRLTDLSWFMKCLNEPIAKQANKEDECTGHFWESRFKSQALLTEEALLSCMAYVDLNPIRAAMAETPEDSAHTSIKERINPEFDIEKEVQSQQEQEVLLYFNLPLKPLLTFDGDLRQEDQMGILFDFNEYLALVDYTGRAIHPKKRGHIPNHLPNILQRLNLNHDHWLEQAMQFEKHYQKSHARQRKKAA